MFPGDMFPGGRAGTIRYNSRPLSIARAVTTAPPTPSSASTPGAAPAIPYQPRHKIRLVTATSLFDGHDASIHIFRRIAQASGAEVIHLGHNRSVQEIVDAAICEDVQGVA